MIPVTGSPAWNTARFASAHVSEHCRISAGECLIERFDTARPEHRDVKRRIEATSGRSRMADWRCVTGCQ